jgi:cell division protein FtsL
MNVGYVTFLTVAAVISVFMCVNFLQLQAKGTKLQKEVTALETQLSAAILENDSDYNRIMTSVDMEHVKDVAMNELGMSYAKKSQIVTYEMEDNDYVRQYSEIPEE